MHFVDQWNEQSGAELQDFPRKTLVPKVRKNGSGLYTILIGKTILKELGSSYRKSGCRIYMALSNAWCRRLGGSFEVLFLFFQTDSDLRKASSQQK